MRADSTVSKQSARTLYRAQVPRQNIFPIKRLDLVFKARNPNAHKDYLAPNKNLAARREARKLTRFRISQGEAQS